MLLAAAAAAAADDDDDDVDDDDDDDEFFVTKMMFVVSQVRRVSFTSLVTGPMRQICDRQARQIERREETGNTIG